MKKSFKSFLKTLGILFLVLAFALGAVHFHVSDLTIHHDCLACFLVHNSIAISRTILTLAVFLFIAQHLFSENTFYSFRAFSLERLRAPPQ
jgi:hypothetical protein